MKNSQAGHCSGLFYGVRRLATPGSFAFAQSLPRACRGDACERRAAPAFSERSFACAQDACERRPPGGDRVLGVWIGGLLGYTLIRELAAEKAVPITSQTPAKSMVFGGG